MLMTKREPENGKQGRKKTKCWNGVCLETKVATETYSNSSEAVVQGHGNTQLAQLYNIQKNVPFK